MRLRHTRRSDVPRMFYELRKLIHYPINEKQWNDLDSCQIGIRNPFQLHKQQGILS